MPQVVLKLPSPTIAKMKTYYAAQQKATPPASALFAAKTNNCTITAYRSGKVLFQGQKPEVEAEKWGKSSSDSPQKKNSGKRHAYYPDDTLFTSSHIGSDEAGTGDYFGPITVAAAFVTKEQIPQLKAIGIKDSKNLSDAQITNLAKDIVAMKIPYSLLRLPNKKYNQWQRKGWSQGKIKTLLHHQALNRLLKKIAPEKPEGLLIDQFSEPHVYQKHLQSENQQLQEHVYFMTKAESYSIAVATASIIARSSFVKAMDQIEFDTGLPIPKGASGKVDRAAAAILEAYGEPKLEEIAKVHFANTQKAKKLVN
ncbi:ribonuclease HIII [Halobacillus karajensis]|uniref:Ribonuclease HIII n=1 Tax=Halobacillus karajensis TaxID=195088 RepID=A0A024P748_9BACI|nr:ribonuclease HIII [Halobacillus karajensis]CDQ18246.1 Ribonuclease HIII [Halobacillus karajensis]CDQ24598.1 Ribonuclease HIII [Halobacillus karajensis]CDQ29155.1 Ribonuclease HIII [Halobacillus karajensis]SEH56561.1 ribonuclease HIII [Halobacillus karajensis]